MGTADLKDAFNSISLPKGIRCVGALLLYCDSKGTKTGKRTYQQLIFNCVSSKDNTTKQFISDPLPPGANVNAAAAMFANKVIGET